MSLLLANTGQLETKLAKCFAMGSSFATLISSAKSLFPASQFQNPSCSRRNLVPTTCYVQMLPHYPPKKQFSIRAHPVVSNHFGDRRGAHCQEKANKIMKIYEKSKITINARPKMNERRFHFSMSEEAREGRPKSQPTICFQNQAFHLDALTMPCVSWMGVGLPLKDLS